MILHRENIDFHTHCARILGECIQGQNKPDKINANDPHTLDCLSLCPLENKEEGYDLSHLQTNRVVNCRKIWSMPVTTSMIE